MRRELSGMSEVDAMSEVLGLMRRTNSNAVLLDKIAARI
jgi:transcription termination factor Rho